tara:strand:+ start:419 stop:532 length:114 start_codon:yes stop_codon:yes gene_type:complete
MDKLYSERILRSIKKIWLDRGISYDKFNLKNKKPSFS